MGNASPNPSRCPECQSRLLQPHEVMDTFERQEVGYWQCVSCGMTFDCLLVGRRVTTRLNGVRRIVLAPGELNILTKESHARTVGKKAKEQANG